MVEKLSLQDHEEWPQGNGPEALDLLDIDSMDLPAFFVQGLQILFCNKHACQLIGYEKNELIGSSIDLIFEDTSEVHLAQVLTKCLKEGGAITTQIKIITKSGDTAPGEAHIVRCMWHNQPVCLVFVKEAGQSLGDNQSLNLIIENAPFGIYMLKGNQFAYVNRAFLKMVGYTWEELSNLQPQRLIHPDDRERVRDKAIKMLKGELQDPYRYRCVKKDGTVIWVIEKVISIKDVGDEKIMAGFFLDITHLKEAEEELKRKNKEYEDTINSITSLFILLDENGNIKKLNRSAQNAFDIRLESSSSYHIGDLFEGGVRIKVLDAFNKCRKTRQKISLDDLRFSYKDGKVGFLEFTFTPIEQNGSKLPGVIVLGADITEKKNLLNQVLQSQKLEAIGQLAAGIAHEINTPVQYIGDNLRFISNGIINLGEMFTYYDDLLKRMVKDQNIISEISKKLTELDIQFYMEELPKAVQQSLEGVDRITKIVISMKNFAHAGILEKVQFDVNSAIESTVTVSKNVWKYVADVELRLDPNLPQVLGYPGEFNQVVLNLIVNAVHAIEDVKKNTGKKGKIVISTQREGDYVLVSISDTGTGIPKEIQSRIFDPFFTTKEPGKGTGQGLSISHRYIVEMHKGQIYFESEMGKGTTFFIKLPISLEEGEGVRKE